jgi:trigger factor
MMKLDIENLSEVRRKLLIEVPSQDVAQEVERAYRELGKKAKVKGFRPGKVPRAVLELYYKKQVEQEVSDSLVRRSLGEALREQALEPVGLSWPETLPAVVAGEDYRFSVEVEVPPEFTVTDYLGLTIQAPAVEVTEEMVDQRLEEIRQNNAILRPIEESRGVKEGDFVVLDYESFFAGQPVEGAKAAETYMEVGAGKFNLDFERQVLGLTPGAETSFTVALPQDFFHPLLAGKVVEFRVKVHDVKEKVVHELDDAFAQSLGGNFQSLADLRRAVGEDIIKVKERERQAQLETQVLDQLLSRTPFEVPPSLVGQEQENMLREQWERMQSHGFKVAGLDPEKMREAMKPQAERRVRVRLVLERLAVQEGLTVDEAELEAGLGRVAARSGRDLAQVKQFYQEHQLLEGLRRQLRDEKVMKLLLDRAQVGAPPSPGEGAAEATESD